MKIGVAQIKNSTDLEGNFKTIMKCLDAFELADCDLVLFPECSLSGFSAKIAECTLNVLNPYLGEVKKWANRTGKMVVLPTAVKEEEIYNTGFVFQRDQVDRFYKVGLTESEQGFFSIPEKYNKQVFEICGKRFIPLICMEAQLDTYKYFDRGDVDFILWPGYWGWEEGDEWQSKMKNGDDQLVYLNSSKWRVPLIQANFAFNDISDRSSGPHGLSVVVDENNKLVYRGTYDEEECFVVDLKKGMLVTRLDCLS